MSSLYHKEVLALFASQHNCAVAGCNDLQFGVGQQESTLDAYFQAHRRDERSSNCQRSNVSTILQLTRSCRLCLDAVCLRWQHITWRIKLQVGSSLHFCSDLSIIWLPRHVRDIHQSPLLHVLSAFTACSMLSRSTQHGHLSARVKKSTLTRTIEAHLLLGSFAVRRLWSTPSSSFLRAIRSFRYLTSS